MSIFFLLRDVTSFACVNILTSIKSCNYGDSFLNAIIYCYFLIIKSKNVHGLKHLRYSSKHFQYCIFTYYPLLIIYTFDGLRKKVYEFSKFFSLPLTKFAVCCAQRRENLSLFAHTNTANRSLLVVAKEGKNVSSVKW